MQKQYKITILMIKITWKETYFKKHDKVENSVYHVKHIIPTSV